MTPENSAYTINDVSNYIDTGVALPGNGTLSKCCLSDLGLLPIEVAGSFTTYFCDHCWSKHSNNGNSLSFGYSMFNSDTSSGVFAISSVTEPDMSNGVDTFIAYV